MKAKALKDAQKDLDALIDGIKASINSLTSNTLPLARTHEQRQTTSAIIGMQQITLNKLQDIKLNLALVEI